MPFHDIWQDFLPHEKLQALNFAADPNFRKLLLVRIQQVNQAIHNCPPVGDDPHKYMRHMTDLFCRKQELEELTALLQEIVSYNKDTENTPQPK